MTTETVDFPQPPRLIGDPKQDSRSIIDWLWAFFNASVTQRGFLTQDDFDSNLAELELLQALSLIESWSANQIIYTSSTSEVAMTTLSPFIRGLLDDADQATAQATLGISTFVADPELLAIAGLTSAADKAPYFTGPGTAALMDVTSYSRGLLALANSTLWRTNLGLAIGSDVQGYDAELAAIAGLTSAADRLPYFTGSGTAALATFTAFGRSLVDDADAAAGRATLLIATGTCTLDAAATTAVTQTAVTASSKVLLFPTNADAAALVGSAASPYISALSAGASFTVATADGSAAGGTETFNYVVIG